MREVLDDVMRWQAAGKRVALATVVSVVGSAPRGTGATLAVSEDGEISGSVSGGCVEPAVIEQGLRTMRTGAPALLQFGISEEQNVEQIGLSCGGEIRVFVEPWPAAAGDTLIEALQEERPAVSMTVVATADAEGLPLGSRVLLEDLDSPDGWSVGLLAGRTFGAEEGALATKAREVLQTGTPATLVTRTETGEEVEVFLAPYIASPTLIVVGAGHITIPLTKLAKVLGYTVIVVDARAAFNTRERLPDADELLVEWPDEALAHLPITGTTAVAVLSHDDKFDVPALVAAMRTRAGYIGAIGSRGTRERRNARLREAGLTEEEIARIHGPIGLDIGAKTPEEIALAILAQVVAARRGKTPR